MFSSFPITSLTRDVFPSSKGESSCFIHATIEVNGVAVNIFVTNFGKTEDQTEIKLQAQKLAKYSSITNGPLIALGHYNKESNEENFQTIRNTGLMETKESSPRCVDYIFYRDLNLLESTRSDRDAATNSQIQAVSFGQPKEWIK